MYFTIKQEKNMLVATDRPLELSRGLELLEKKNQEALETKQTMLCSYELTYQGKVIYQSSLEFPIENFDLFEQIKSDLTQVSANETDVQEFIIFLAPFFPKKKEVKETTRLILLGGSQLRVKQRTHPLQAIYLNLQMKMRINKLKKVGNHYQ